jgi:hypothetical protein
VTWITRCSKTKVDGQDAIVLGNTKADEVAALLKNNPEAKADALALLSRPDVDSGAILKGLQALDPDEAAGLIKKLRDFKEVDEAVLRQAIADYRKTTGIAKTADGGGVVASGKAEFRHAGVDDAKYSAGSTHAQVEPAVHNPRYGHPNRGENWAKLLDNHAEQNVLGDIANKIDDVYAGKIPRTDVTGTVTMTVDQKVCNACRAGLQDGQAGILKQFSNEFPNVTVMIGDDGWDGLVHALDGLAASALDSDAERAWQAQLVERVSKMHPGTVGEEVLGRPVKQQELSPDAS